MKEEKTGDELSRRNDASQSQPQPSFEPKRREPYDDRRPTNLSQPPKRDMSGRRIDVDENGYGFEIW